MSSVIIENPTAIKYATIAVSELYIDLILLYYLHQTFIPKRKCKILAWVFFLSTLVQELAYLMAAIFLHTTVQVILGYLAPWDSVLLIAMYTLVFLVFEGDPLINWLKYCAIDFAFSAVFLVTNSLLLALGYTHDMTTVSTVTDLPRFLLVNILMGIAIWFAIKYVLKLINKICQNRKFAHCCSLICLALVAVSFCYSEAFISSSITFPMVKAICVLFLSLILIFAAVISFLYWRLQQTALQEENANLQSVLSMQYEHFQQLEQYQTQLHQQNHDFRHHLTILKTLLADGKSEAANDYLNTLQASHTQLPTVNYCGNIVVDAALSSKRALAESQNIRVNYQIQLPQTLHPSDVDLSCAISNLLDNAIESCAQVTEGPKRISFSAQVTSGLLLMIAKNSCLPEPISFQTSKAGDHGWGLEILRNIAVRNSGTFEITQNGNTVTAVLSLANPQNETLPHPSNAEHTNR